MFTCGDRIIRPSGATCECYSATSLSNRCLKAEVDGNVLGRLLSLHVHRNAMPPLMRNEAILGIALL
jgi:hypothetical protein